MVTKKPSAVKGDGSKALVYELRICPEGMAKWKAPSVYENIRRQRQCETGTGADAYYGFLGKERPPFAFMVQRKKYMRTGPLMLRRKPVFTPSSLEQLGEKSDNGQISSDPAGDKVCTAVVSDGKVSADAGAGYRRLLLGNIYIGKVQKVVSNINAAFIDIGPGCTGYYSLQNGGSRNVLRPATSWWCRSAKML